MLFGVGTLVVSAQGGFSNEELGFSFGGLNYLGDLNNQSMLGRLNVGAGIHFRHKANDRWAFTIGAAYGKLEGGNPDVIPSRNLSFVSQVWEASARAEFNFFPFGLSGRQAFWCPFMFCGIGLFHFNPMAEYTDPVTGETSMVELQPLGTEGQGLAQYPDRDPYSRFQVMMPFGVGMKYRPSRSLIIALEYGFRKTWTDYLDDVSTTYVNPDLLDPVAAAMSDRGGSAAKSEAHHAEGLKRGDDSLDDWYAFLNLSVNVSMEYMFGWMLKKRCKF